MKKSIAVLSAAVLLMCGIPAMVSADTEDTAPDWVCLEDFDGDGDKAASAYTVWANAGVSSFLDNGEDGNALKFSFGTSWGGEGLWMPQIESLRQELPEGAAWTWYKFDLKGPKAVDANAADGYFQVQPGFNDCALERRLAWSNEAPSSDLVGYVYARRKGETQWTKLQGVNFRLPNDFDGEIMLPFALVGAYAEGDQIKFTTDPLDFNAYFSERMGYSMLDDTESVAVDNICVSAKDMAPETYRTMLQDNNAEAAQVVTAQGAADYAAIVTREDGGRVLQLTSPSDSFNPGITFNSTLAKGADYVEFYIEGPGGDANNGWFQILPTIHGEGGWLGMSDAAKVGFDNDKTGAVYLKPEGADQFVQYYCGSLVKLPNDFKGLVRYEIARFNSVGLEYSPDAAMGDILYDDSSYFSYVEVGRTIILGGYTAVKGKMVKGTDYTVDGERNGDTSPVVFQNFDGLANDDAIQGIGSFSAAKPSLASSGDGKALKLLSGGMSMNASIKFSTQNLTEAKYLEVTLTGPDAGKASGGTFEYAPGMQVGASWYQMAGGDTPGLTDDTPQGVVYYQPKGSQDWFELQVGSKFLVDRRFEGKIRLPLDRFVFDTVAKTLGAPNWMYAVATSDYFTGLKKDEFLLLDDYTLIYADMTAKAAEGVTVTMPANPDDGKTDTDQPGDKTEQPGDNPGDGNPDTGVPFALPMLLAAAISGAAITVSRKRGSR